MGLLERLHEEICAALESGMPPVHCRGLISEYVRLAEEDGLTATAAAWRQLI